MMSVETLPGGARRRGHLQGMAQVPGLQGEISLGRLKVGEDDRRVLGTEGRRERSNPVKPPADQVPLAQQERVGGPVDEHGVQGVRGLGGRGCQRLLEPGVGFGRVPDRGRNVPKQAGGGRCLDPQIQTASLREGHLQKRAARGEPAAHDPHRATPKQEPGPRLAVLRLMVHREDPLRQPIAPVQCAGLVVEARRLHPASEPLVLAGRSGPRSVPCAASGPAPAPAPRRPATSRRHAGPAGSRRVRDARRPARDRPPARSSAPQTTTRRSARPPPPLAGAPPARESARRPGPSDAPPRSAGWATPHRRPRPRAPSRRPHAACIGQRRPCSRVPPRRAGCAGTRSRRRRPPGCRHPLPREGPRRGPRHALRRRRRSVRRSRPPDHGGALHHVAGRRVQPDQPCTEQLAEAVGECRGVGRQPQQFLHDERVAL